MTDAATSAQPGRRFLLTLGAVGLLLGLGWAVDAWYYRGAAPTAPVPEVGAGGMFDHPDRLNLHYLRLVSTADTQGQKLAHRAILVGLCVLVVAGAWFARRSPRALTTGLAAASALLVAVVLAAVGRQLLDGSRHWRLYALGAAVVLGLYGFGPRLDSPPGRALCRWLTAVALAFFLLPAAFFRLDLSGHGWDALEVIQAHYSYLLSQGDRLAAGFHYRGDIDPYYGFVLPLVTGAWQRHVGPLSLHGYMILIEALQAIYLLAAVYVCWFHGRKRWVGPLLVVALVVPVFHFYNRFLFYGAPNHTAWRSLAFPLALVGLIAIRHLTLRPASFLLGLGAGLALLYNPETGIAVAAGYVAYGWFQYLPPGRAGRPRDLASALGLGALGVGAAYGLLWVAYRGLLGERLTASVLWACVDHMRFMSATGLGGTRGAFNPLAALILGHALFALVWTWFHRAPAPSFFASLRAATATMILVWFAYFVNRPDPEYLYSFLVLYVVLLTDIARLLTLARRLRPRRAALQVACAAAVLGGVVVPSALPTLRAEFRMYRRGMAGIDERPHPDRAVRLSGVYLPNDQRARDVRARAAHLKSLPTEPRPVYLTADTFLVPKLSGVWSAIPMVDPFWESLTERKYRRLLDRIVTSKSDVIYLDPELGRATETAPRGSREFYGQLRKDLANHFERKGTAGGWELWSRHARGPRPR